MKKSKKSLLLSVFAVMLFSFFCAAIVHIDKVQATMPQPQALDFYADGLGQQCFSYPSDWQLTTGYCQLFEDDQRICKVATLISPNGLVLTYYSNLPDMKSLERIYTSDLKESYFYSQNYGFNEDVWTVQTETSIGLYTKFEDFEPGYGSNDKICAFYGEINQYTSTEDILAARKIIGSVHP